MNGEELKDTWEFMARGLSSEWFCLYKRGSILLLNDRKGEPTRREQWVPAVVRAGQAGLLQKCFTDSSAQEGQKSVSECPCLIARFVRTVFWRQLQANLSEGWSALALDGKKNIFSWDQGQIYPLLPLLWKTAASLSTKWNMHQKPGQPHAGGQSSSIIRNLWGDAWFCRTFTKRKKKSDLLNKLQFQNIFSALKFTLSETVPTDKQFTQVAQMCWTHHGLTEYFSVFMSVQYKSA